MSEAFVCYNDEMFKCCEERLDELQQVAAALGSQQTLLAAHEALQERWETMRKKSTHISDDLKQKANRWAIVEPLVAELETKLNHMAMFIEELKNEQDSRTNSGLMESLQKCEDFKNQLNQLEHLVLPLGHHGQVLLNRLKSRHQFQFNFLQESVKHTINSQELRDAAFAELNQLKFWFEQHLSDAIANPSRLLETYKIDQLNKLFSEVADKENELAGASNRAMQIYSDRNLNNLISSLQRQFQLAKSNINAACEKFRKEIAHREEAGIQLVTLLTALQEAELTLADPIPPDEDEPEKARKDFEKISTQLDQLQVQLVELEMRYQSEIGNAEATSESEVMSDVLQAANHQINRVNQLAELREKQISKVKIFTVLFFSKCFYNFLGRRFK